MSNNLAVATVTAAFSAHLARFIDEQGVPGARVTTLHPGTTALRDGDPLVNLYLFRVARNAFVSNQDLPTRTSEGRPAARPTARIDLDYMVTFFGDDTRLETHRLLGGVVAGLHAEPALDRSLIQAAIAQTPWLAGSTLGDRAAPVTITPVNLPPDVMARIWSEFVNQPYQLTVFYTAAAIGLDVPIEIAPSLPVRSIGLTVWPAGPLAVRGIVDAEHPDLPVTAGCTLAIRLADAGRPDYRVLLNGVPAVKVQARRDAFGHACLTLPLTTEQPALTVGRLSVLVQRTAADGRTIIARSPDLPVPVLPAIAGTPAYDATRRTATVHLPLPIAARQPTALLLFPLQPMSPAGTAQKVGSDDGAPSPVRIPLPPAEQPTDTLVFPLSDDLHGTYLAIVECNGLQSVPGYAAGRYVSPLVEIGKAP
jgi:hypothetical protein